MTWLNTAGRSLQRVCRGRDTRNLVVAGTFLFLVVAWPVLAASGVLAVHVTAVPVTAVALLLPAAVWAFQRRRVHDAEFAALLVLFSAVATALVLSYEAPNIRWACAVGLISVPLLTLMMTSVRWVVVASAVSLAGQVAVVASIPATPQETLFAVAIICTVLPLNVGNATLLVRRTRRLQAQAERAASVDHLTGLLNRRALRQRWPDLLAAARSEGELPGVLLVDVDHFKAINDTHGHDAGDAVLAALGEHLQRSVRPRALVVRLGGEEFAVVDGFADTATAVEVAERLRRRTTLIDVDAVSAVSISVGVATCAELHRDEADAELLGALLSLADTALYRAKTSGRDRVVLADPTTGRSSDTSTDLSTASADAVGRP